MPPPNGSGMSRRPSLQNPIPSPPVAEIYSDSRFHGPQSHGPPKQVRITHAASYGGGSISKSEDGHRCIVAGKESLRILRICEPGVSGSEHKSAVGRGGYRIDSSRNMWAGSGLKIDSSSTDVVWGHGTFSNKILTSARNGELIVWDLNKSGSTKYERRIKEHARAIHNIAYSTTLQYYCITASADGYIRVWDLRDMSSSITQIRHPSSVRAVVLSPVSWRPLQAVSALDSGSIHMWDLRMGQRGQLHRIPLAHNGPVLTLDWTLPSTLPSSSRARGEPLPASPQASAGWYSNMSFGQFDDIGVSTGGPNGGNSSTDADSAGSGWLASGGMDKCVKIWSLSTPSGEAHVSRQPVYTLNTSFPVRRVLWRPGYECELAVVSNVEFDTGVKATQPMDSVSPTPSGSPHPQHAEAQDIADGDEARLAKLSNASGVGDSVEIWDVRRQYVAKWSVRGSSFEGGITDIDFADSHTMWTQHFSGTFSQLDLRSATRPIDQVPRTAMTWDATGTLTFVAGKPGRWEVPYDDVNPEKRASKRKAKALGDKPFIPTSQSVGTMSGHGLMEDVETFVKLAHGYVIEGPDKTVLCSRNAEVASAAGKFKAVQVWQLLASLLTNIVPSEAPTPTPTRSLSPLPFVSPRLPHSTSAPAAIPTIAQSRTVPTSLPHLTRSVSESVYGTPTSKNSSGPKSHHSTPSSRSNDQGRTHSGASLSISSSGTGYLSPQRLTPSSSTTTSPHRPASPLPPVSSSVVSPAFPRKPSGSGSGLSKSLIIGPPSARPRQSSSALRRPSFSTQGIQGISESVSDSRSQSHLSLRHVGEGALDDSDSEGSDDGKGPDEHSDEERQVVSQTTSTRSSFRSRLNSRSNSVQPSPLSQVAGQQTWTEDEKEEEESPSPASTDSGPSSEDDQPRPGLHSRRISSASSRVGSSSTRPRRHSTRSGKSKVRSRSSTVASLTVSTTSSHGRLMKQESQSSIRTVTATPTPTSTHTSGIQRDETLKDLGTANTYTISSTLMNPRADGGSMRSSSFSQSRPRSEVPSNDQDIELGRKSSDSSLARAAYAARQERVKETEQRLRDAGWEAMRETLESFADEGDVQMCAMLSLVAPEELRIRGRRVLRFLESYIELLMRLRLHTTAAYIRKFSAIEDILNTTGLETTIYTSCAKCRKPLLHPAVKPSYSGVPTGSYAYCSSCKNNPTRCSICRLPVRVLLFQCPVCLHGGHSACYQQYYLRRPLMKLPIAWPPANPSDAHHSSPTTPESKHRGRAMSRSVDGEGSDDGLSSKDGEDGKYRNNEVVSVETKNDILGHPCAAGCGHYCWAANEGLLLNTSDPDVRFE